MSPPLARNLPLKSSQKKNRLNQNTKIKQIIAFKLLHSRRFTNNATTCTNGNRFRFEHLNAIIQTAHTSCTNTNPSDCTAGIRQRKRCSEISLNGLMHEQRLFIVNAHRLSSIQLFPTNTHPSSHPPRPPPSSSGIPTNGTTTNDHHHLHRVELSKFSTTQNIAPHILPFNFVHKTTLKDNNNQNNNMLRFIFRYSKASCSF